MVVNKKMVVAATIQDNILQKFINEWIGILF